VVEREKCVFSLLIQFPFIHFADLTDYLLFYPHVWPLDFFAP